MTDRIAAIAARLIESPIVSARAQGSGAIARHVRRIIVQVRTAEGLEGWGEAAPWAPFGNTAETSFAALPVLRDAILGRDPAAITLRAADCAAAIAGHPEAKAALDMALWDIAGKRAGMPLHDLFGGPARPAVKLSFSLADPDLEADLDRAARMVADGHRIFKVKTGFSTAAHDIARLERIRARVPTAELRVDYNQGLAPFGALAVLRDVAALRPTFIEQPFPRGQEAAMAEIAARIDVPLMADESVGDATDALALARTRYAACASIKLMKAGGIGAARAIDAILATAGLPSYGGTLWEGGIALAAGAHVAIASSNMTLGCEFYMQRHALARDIVSTALPIADGMIRPPPGPGLGVAIDMAALAEGTVAVL